MATSIGEAVPLLRATADGDDSCRGAARGKRGGGRRGTAKTSKTSATSAASEATAEALRFDEAHTILLTTAVEYILAECIELAGFTALDAQADCIR